MVHLITVEFMNPQTAEMVRFEATLRELGDCYAFQRGTWVVQAERSNQEICQRLAGLIRPGDRLLVTRINRDWAGANIPDVEAHWLSERNYASNDDEGRVSRVPLARR